MADWIWNAANEKQITDVEIDILNGSVNPKELEIKPIIVHLYQLRSTISKTLKSNSFPDDFITEAKFQIYISQKYKFFGLLTCKTFLEDMNGNKYEGNTYTEQTGVDPFKVFQKWESDRFNRK